MSDKTMCEICKKPSQLKCGNCREVSYCCKDHQKEDWKNHKPNCLSYKVTTNEIFGRHLIATRTIYEGEIIIKEAPIVAGPSQETPPVCLGCLELLTQSTAKNCSKCGWPICSEECANSLSHRPECEITCQHKKSKVKINTFVNDLPHPSYQCLTVLRCLYLKNTYPDLWEKLMNLESHCEERKSTAKYNIDRQFIAEFIPQFFNLHDFSTELILKVAGIVQVNAHDIPLREPSYIAIYEKASFLEHNCRANCMKSFTNSGELVIRAAEKISPGDHLSICYTDPMWGKEARINHLMETKFFLCQCARCLDPTEFGTHFNSLKCFDRKCDGFSFPVPNSDSHGGADNQEDSKNLVWKCQKCQKDSTDHAHKVIAGVYGTLTQMNKKNKKSCTDFIEKYERLLHPNHHLLVKVKMSLIDILVSEEKLFSLTDKTLEWMLKTCGEIYYLTTTLVPAENRLRGVILYQLFFGMREYSRRKTKRRQMSAKQLKEHELESKSILAKAYNCLRFEPDELCEGKMAIEAKRVLENPKEWLT